MGKLAKFRGGMTKAKNYAKGVAKGEGVGSLGHELVTAGTHALLAIAAKSSRTVGPIPMSPDTLGLIVSGIGMMVGKGKLRKTARSTAKGALHALITRGVNDGSFPTFGPVEGASEK